MYIIRLIPEVKRLAEVVISSERQSATVNTVSNKLSSAAIDQSLGKSLASLLEQVSGVSSIQTGTTVAKPVIQGMHGNRILIINNGARQTGQQWGADHAPEVDMNNSGSIQVVKGADAVRYGSEALGGIIVMDQKTLPFRQKELKGKATSLYGSNGHRYAFVGQIESSLPFLRNIAWRVQGTYSNSGDRSTANYLLNNTGTREFNFSAGIGYDRERLRIESFYSRYDNRMGVMLSAQMGSEDLLAERIRLGRPVLVDPFTRSITYPRQRVVHETLIGKVKYDTGRWGELFWQGSWQKDKRTENRIRRMNHSHIPAIGLNLKSFQNFVRWNIGYGAWQTEAGGQFMLIDNYSQAGTGVVPVIPNYTETSWGPTPYRSFTATAGTPKPEYVQTTKRQEPQDTTGRELPTEVRVSSETSLTVSEPDIRYPISGGSHRI
ncbi:outer membrane hemin receptor [Bacteroides pyogenes JCM 6292]|uniref:Outer membrane hemin receptor n=1 Tax=Bacteroides pyogenes JCM 6292 TaxID=1235809 RepID=W4PAJ2_9BACE|nr:outer membrane hemin receptor [Bacteroides pyogenes JCM 6292]